MISLARLVADLGLARQHRFGCRQNVPFGALAIELQQVNARQSEIGNQPGKRDHRHLFGGRGGCRILAAVAVGVGDAFVASERSSDPRDVGDAIQTGLSLDQDAEIA